MRKLNLSLMLLAVSMLLIASCTTTRTAMVVPQPKPIDLTDDFTSGKLVSKVNGLVVLLDASSSMAQHYAEYKKFDIAKAFVHHMNDTIPPIQAMSGLRTFGHAPELSRESSRRFYGMAAYNRKEMKTGLDKVAPSGGPTPMAHAIKGAGQDLTGVKGSKAVIIVSDGKDLNEEPIQAANNLVAQLGKDLCIYTVLVGDDENGRAVMERLAKSSPCGFMALAQDYFKPRPMADYVTEVFLSRAEPVAQASELEAAKNEKPGLGYHKPEPVIPQLGNVHFKFDSADLTEKGKTILDNHIRVLNKQSGLKLIVNGHTSLKGTKAYNQKLSEERAASVKNYLVDKGRIDPERISAVGYGKTQPAIHETDPKKIDSKEARTNMRVVFEIITE